MIDIEELKRIAQEDDGLEEKLADVSQLSVRQRRVHQFLRENNITNGDDKVPMYLLYQQYSKWHRAKKYKEIVGPVEFGRRLSKLFVKGKSGKYAYYKVNCPFDISREARRKAKISYNKHRNPFSEHVKKKKSKESLLKKTD